MKPDIPGDAELLVRMATASRLVDRITTGSLNLQDLLKYKGRRRDRSLHHERCYLVYAAQGHEISAKHRDYRPPDV